MKFFPNLKPTERIDLINILLMIPSAILAYLFPFALFLFSYAIFGPLHYLTEISWLHNKKYFVSFTYIVPLLTIISFIMVYLLFVPHVLMMSVSTSLMFFAFFGSFILVICNNTMWRYIYLSIVLLLAVLIRQNQLTFILFAVLLPTIIHVFVFTGSFMFYGALKSKSKIGFLSVLAFILCFILLFLVTVNLHTFTVNSYIKSAYASFSSVNLEIMNLVNIHNPNVQYAIYHSPAGLSIMRFIAFAYSYHYLNWFSKTKIIHWDAISRLRLNVIIAFWIMSVILYIFNYEEGLIALYFLSLLHVLLEFPLNHRSFVGIYEEINKLISGDKGS